MALTQNYARMALSTRSKRNSRPHKVTATTSSITAANPRNPYASRMNSGARVVTPKRLRKTF